MMPPVEAEASPQNDGSLGFDALGLAGGAARRGRALLLVLQAMRTLLRLGFSGCVAMLVGTLVMGGSAQPWLAAAIGALLLLSAAAGGVADRVQAGTETAVAVLLRGAAASRLEEMTARQVQAIPAGGLIVGLQRHPEAVAALVVGHRAARTMMTLGPLAAAAMLLVVSWQAALLVVLLTPVMIVFLALVGDALHRRAEAQERAFGRLAGQFADRIRTLPTILANHALAAEEAKLAARLEAYAANTMGVLRIAFLNAAILDFFASLSIAMLAVFLGLGHLKLAMIPGFSDLELRQSLFILMIAPDFFAPFRRFAEQYHAKAEGVAAAAALDRLFDAAPPSGPPATGLAVEPLPAAGLVAIVGPSGAGKSTLLRRLAGVDEPWDRKAEAVGPAPIWIGTDSFVPDGTLGEAIAWHADDPDQARLLLAAGSVGFLDDALLPGGLSARVGANGAELSGGQRLRIGAARAMLARGTVFADEPTAKLDPATAASIRRILLDLSASRLVIAATHDPALAALAARRIDLPPPAVAEAAR